MAPLYLPDTQPGFFLQLFHLSQNIFVIKNVLYLL